jgi:hypothetical protein
MLSDSLLDSFEKLYQATDAELEAIIWPDSDDRN